MAQRELKQAEAKKSALEEESFLSSNQAEHEDDRLEL
jgi:hypothetical protein